LFAASLLSILLILHAHTEMDEYEKLRRLMVEEQIIKRGIKDREVIRAMLKVPREKFVPPQERGSAYGDFPLPIGYGQTISQPYIVAYMTEQLEVKKGDRVLEIGTGSGYQSAILAEIGCEVYTVELIEELSKRAQRIIKELGYKNVHFKIGDGYQGWKEYAPYDAIIVTAAPPRIPEKLKYQMKIGGRMVIPVGDYYQYLYKIARTGKDSWKKERLIGVSFVPMVRGN